MKKCIRSGNNSIPINERMLKHEKHMDNMIEYYTAIVFCSCYIILYRDYGWREVRLNKMKKHADDIYAECAASNDINLISMCEAETGIEVQNRYGKSWKDVKFLNPELGGVSSSSEFIMMRNRQADWMIPLITASVLLALCRRYKTYTRGKVYDIYYAMKDIQDHYELVVNPPKKRKKDNKRMNDAKYIKMARLINDECKRVTDITFSLSGKAIE